MEPTVQAALNQIDQADLTAAQYRAVRRLLDVAAATGHAKLTKEHCSKLCSTTSEGAMRRLLGSLQQAGIIHYSTNGFVYIDFTAWSANGQQWLAEPNEPITAASKSDHPRADLARGRADLDHAAIEDEPVDDKPASKSDHPRADLARGRADLDLPRADLDHNEAATYTRARTGELVSLLDPILSLEEDLTNKLTPDPESQALSFALLTYIRVKPAALAKQLASDHSLFTIREAISHWWFNRKSLGGQFEETPGIVVYWLNNWQSAGVPALSAHFQRTELYRNFRTQAEQAADRQAEAELAAVACKPQPVVTAPAVVQPADPHAAIWDQMLAELRLTLADATYQAFIRDTKARSQDGCHWTIQVANKGSMDWVQNRLANKIKRSLAILTNQSVTVEFCLEATA